MPVGEAPNLSHPLRRALGAVLASWLLIATAVAQEPPPADPAPSPPAPAAAPPAFSAMRLPGLAAAPPATKNSAASDSDLQTLIGTLEDETRRAELIARLKALSVAVPSTGGRSTRVSSAMCWIPSTARSRSGSTASARRWSAWPARSEQLPVLISWIRLQLTDPVSRQFWWSIGQQVGLAGIAGLLASLLVRLAAARLAGRSDQSAAGRADQGTDQGVAGPSRRRPCRPDHVPRGDLCRAPPTPAVSILAQRVAGDILFAIAGVRGITALSRAYLAPKNPRRRLARLTTRRLREPSGGWRCCSALASTAISGSRPRAGSACPGPSMHS